MLDDERIDATIRATYSALPVPPVRWRERQPTFALVPVLAGAALVAVLALILGAGVAVLRAPQPGAVGSSQTPGPSRGMPEREAWDAVRRALPADVAVIMPGSLPAQIDRSRVALEGLVADPAQPRYRIDYSDGSAVLVSFGLGEPAPLATPTSALGTTVRNVAARLSFPASTSSPRRVTWQEGSRTYWIESSALSGNDLLAIAWHVTSTTPAPALAHPYTRTQPGTCAATDATAVVRRLYELASSGSPDTVLDCYALEYIGRSGPAFATSWAGFGPASQLEIQQEPAPFGDRTVLRVTFTFASGRSPYGQRTTQFFVVGSEDGQLRIFDVTTAVPRVP